LAAPRCGSRYAWQSGLSNNLRKNQALAAAAVRDYAVPPGAVDAVRM
jgi:hypothetical protein